MPYGLKLIRIYLTSSLANIPVQKLIVVVKNS
jgi:hypothetical protein